MESTKQQHHATANQPELFIPNIQTQTRNQPPIYSKAIIPTDCVSTYTLKTYTTYQQTAPSALQK